MWSKAVKAFKPHFSSSCKVLVTVTMSQELFVRTEWNEHLAWSPAHIKSSVNGVLGSHGVLCKWKSLSPVWLLATPWTTVHGILQAGILEWVTFPSPGDLPNPGIEPRSPALQADSLPAEPKGSPRILEWVACPFSKGSSWLSNLTGISYMAGGFL